MWVCIYLSPVFFPDVLTDLWTCQPDPTAANLKLAKTLLLPQFIWPLLNTQLSPPFPPQVCVLAFTFLLLFLGNFLTTLKVVHTKLQKNKDKMKKLWTLQGVLGANFGARCPCAHSRRSALDGASLTAAALQMDFEELICPVFGEGCGLFQHRLSILCKHGSPVCSPAIYVYLIPNVFALGFSVYIAACTCLARSQHWENVGSTVIPVLEWYLTLPSFII